MTPAHSSQESSGPDISVPPTALRAPSKPDLAPTATPVVAVQNQTKKIDVLAWCESQKHRVPSLGRAFKESAAYNCNRQLRRIRGSRAHQSQVGAPTSSNDSKPCSSKVETTSTGVRPRNTERKEKKIVKRNATEDNDHRGRRGANDLRTFKEGTLSSSGTGKYPQYSDRGKIDIRRLFCKRDLLRRRGKAVVVNDIDTGGEEPNVAQPARPTVCFDFFLRVNCIFGGFRSRSGRVSVHDKLRALGKAIRRRHGCRNLGHQVHT